MGVILFLTEELFLTAAIQRLEQESLDLETQKAQITGMANAMNADQMDNLSIFAPTTMLEMNDAERNWAAYQNCVFTNEVNKALYNPNNIALISKGLPNDPQSRRAGLAQRIMALIKSAKEKMIASIKKKLDQMSLKINIRLKVIENEMQIKNARLQKIAQMKQAAIKREYGGGQ